MLRKNLYAIHQQYITNIFEARFVAKALLDFHMQAIALSLGEHMDPNEAVGGIPQNSGSSVADFGPYRKDKSSAHGPAGRRKSKIVVGYSAYTDKHYGSSGIFMMPSIFPCVAEQEQSATN